MPTQLWVGIVLLLVAISPFAYQGIKNLRKPKHAEVTIERVIRVNPDFDSKSIQDASSMLARNLGKSLDSGSLRTTTIQAGGGFPGTDLNNFGLKPVILGESIPKVLENPAGENVVLRKDLIRMDSTLKGARGTDEVNIYCVKCKSQKTIRLSDLSLDRTGRTPRLFGMCPTCGKKLSKYVKES